MKTSELIDHVAETAGIDKAHAKKAVEAVFQGITSSMKQGDDVNLSGFGKFKVKDVPPRQGRNPSTGQPIEISAARRLTFSPAKQIKDALAS